MVILSIIKVGVCSMDLGKRIKFYRNKKGLTQAKLADLAHVSNGLIGQIETGKTYPSIPSLKSIAEALGVTISKLLEDETITITDAEAIDLDNLQNLQLRHNYRLLSVSEKEKLQGIINNALALKEEGESYIPVSRNDFELNEEKLLKTVEQVVQSILDKRMGKHERKVLREKYFQVVRTSKNPPPSSWYTEEIKKGRSLNDADFLCRLLMGDIIEPTIHGYPLTPEQKNELIKFIESHKDLLADFEANGSELPENYAAHDEGAESLELRKALEPAAFIKASDIINEMLHLYLEEEKKKS